MQRTERKDICPYCGAVMTYMDDDDYRCMSCDVAKVLAVVPQRGDEREWPGNYINHPELVEELRGLGLTANEVEEAIEIARKKWWIQEVIMGAWQQVVF